MVAANRPPYLAILFWFDQAKVASEVKHRVSSHQELSYKFVLSVITERGRSRVIECGQIDPAHCVDHVIRGSDQLDCLEVKLFVTTGACQLVPPRRAASPVGGTSNSEVRGLAIVSATPTESSAPQRQKAESGPMSPRCLPAQIRAA